MGNGHGANSCNKDKLIDDQVDYYDERDKPCEMLIMGLISRAQLPTLTVTVVKAKAITDEKIFVMMSLRIGQIMTRITGMTKRCGGCFEPSG